MKNFDFLTIAPIRVIADKKIFEKKLLQDYNFVFGKNPILIVKNDVLEKFHDIIYGIFNKNFIIKFNEECSKKEIKRIFDILAKMKDPTSIVGIGGGKAIDTAKAVANLKNLPIITVPTSSATGACGSALSAIYHEDGTIDEDRDIVFTKAPDLAVIDYSLLFEVPKKFLIFGIADSLAKYYEAFAFCGGTSNDIFIQTALNLSESIKKIIFETAEKAIYDFENKILSDELKNIFKINLILAPLVGGIGGEGCRVCVSHAVNNSLTQIKKIRDKKFMHGEQVAFGNLMQLFLDKRQKAKKDFEDLLSLHKKLNLMQNFDYFGVKLDKKDIDLFINYIFSDIESLKNMPREILEDEFIECMKFFKMI